MWMKPGMVLDLICDSSNGRENRVIKRYRHFVVKKAGTRKRLTGWPSDVGRTAFSSETVLKLRLFIVLGSFYRV